MYSSDKKCPDSGFARPFLDTTVEEGGRESPGREVTVLDIIVIAFDIAIVLAILWHFVLCYVLDL